VIVGMYIASSFPKQDRVVGWLLVLRFVSIERTVMKFQKLLPVAITAISIFAATSVQAGAIVTIDPQANNGGAGVVSAAQPFFDTDGFLGSLVSTLNISGLAGAQSYSETGRVLVSAFQLGAANLVTNVAQPGGYNLIADFSLTGSGSWSGNTFTANPFGNVMTFSLGADTDMNGSVDIVLGTGALSGAFPAIAFASVFPPLPGLPDPAFTSFTATVDFTPAVGTEGVGGFFRAPTPFSIDIFAGNVGGTLNDTTYVVNGDGSVSITTVGGSGNFDFVNQVPEPSSLALVGLALAGVGFVSRRKERAQA
jgi:hypothetical protein